MNAFHRSIGGDDEAALPAGTSRTAASSPIRCAVFPHSDRQSANEIEFVTGAEVDVADRWLGFIWSPGDCQVKRRRLVGPAIGSGSFRRVGARR